ncbi:FHA domain-containing protein [Frigoribacterium sp. VKM Ac-2836]|uniref:FHA domain-containing protein n=1 Tax=Frigoribacterium sp. VKM Ac-2836 TaxID=2739014 RepID=UPI0015654ED1|nr:FHA domain-containing protein [Frigoribacterium sp. VKM Ac-2836]NRD26407.1 RDD family protein [Frigoribacterium sp. VKM Ac-2836]
MRIVSAATGSAIGTYSGLLAGVQTATPSRRRSAVAIDWGVPLLLIAVLVVGVATGASSATPGAALVPAPVEVAVVVVALALVALDVVLYVRGGRSTGRLLLSLRTVDDLTGRPPAVLRVDRRGRFSFRRQTVTVDLRRGRDPMTSSPPLVQRPALPVAAAAPLPPHPTEHLDAGRPDENTFGRTGQGRPAAASSSIVLELDSGERLDLETTLLIGRAPVNREGEEHPVFAWADLARSLTKTHALFAWEGAVLWVTDLGSTNGSSLVAPDGTRQPLVAGLRGPAAPGYVVELGERTLTVQPSGVVDA